MTPIQSIPSGKMVFQSLERTGFGLIAVFRFPNGVEWKFDRSSLEQRMLNLRGKCDISEEVAALSAMESALT